MIDVLTAHTADLDPVLRDASRALMYDTFDDMAEDDWEHALGGVHAVVLDDGVVIGHGSVVQRRLTHGGRPLRAGYVEAVAVRADRQREGHGASLMRELERVIVAAYDLGALGATDEGAAFYASRGWQAWRGPLAVLSPEGVRPTPDEQGGVLVLPAAVGLDLDGDLVCDWRDGDVW